MVSSRITEAALFGLRFAAEKDGLPLHAHKAEWIADVVANHTLNAAINSGEFVVASVHTTKIEKLERRVKQFENWWAGTKVESDHQLQRIQAALSHLEDRTLAQRLAEEIGVILLPE